MSRAYVTESIARIEQADKESVESLQAYAQGPEEFLAYLDRKAKEAVERIRSGAANLRSETED